MTLTYGSVCSGIEAASEAWKVLGWEAKFFAEIEAFPSAGKRIDLIERVAREGKIP